MSPTDLYSIYGIRHHGPGSARSLINGLQSQKPDIILVEGPPDAQDLLQWVNHPQMLPPVAILIFDVANTSRAVYYPFADYSPEWQAIQFGLKHGIPVRFMDLPQAYQLGEADTQPVISEMPHPDAVMLHDPLSLLAQAAGYADSERWWEDLVEKRADSQELFKGILEMITALRAEVEKQLDTAQTQAFEQPVEAAREAWMRQTMRQALVEGFKNVAVICGAWHAPALMDISGHANDEEILAGIKPIKTDCAWVPWSNSRLASASGYGAGIQSPGWYEVLWQAAEKHATPQEISIQWLSRVAHFLRQEDMAASSAQVIDAVRLADTLAALRGQHIPGLNEFSEAIRAVYCFGDDLPLSLIHRKLVINERMGSVPPDVPQTPFQVDLAVQQKSLRLKPSPLPETLDLDLRKPIDLKRSYLLFRLNMLEIGWGEHMGAAKKSGTFHEFWQLAWRPEFALKLVESSLWGNTVTEAAVNYALHQAESLSDMRVLATSINLGLKADLPQVVAVLVARLNDISAVSADIIETIEACLPLFEALRYSDVRQTDASMLRQALDGMLARIFIGLPAVCAGVNDEAAETLYGLIMGVDLGLTMLQVDDYITAWRNLLVQLADQPNLHGLLAGKICGILLEKKAITAEEAANRLSLALSAGNEPAYAAQWIEGLVKKSSALIIYDRQFFAILDAWLTGLSAEAFVHVLPMLRRAFSSFSPAERRKIFERVVHVQADGHEDGDESQFDHVRAEKMLPVCTLLLGIAPER